MRLVDINNSSREVEKISRARLRAFIRALDKHLPTHLRAPQGCISIAILDDADMARVHGQFLGDPTTTDVITFEGSSADGEAGEVCAGAQTALRMCRKYAQTPDEELCLYVAHGYLHLAGVNDISEQEAKEMRAAEKLAMEILRKSSISPIFTFKKQSQ